MKPTLAMIGILALGLVAGCTAPAPAPHARPSPDAPAPGPRIVLISAEPEYRSADSLARLAAQLERDLHARTTLLKAEPAKDAPDNIPGMEALDGADLVVVFMRFCRLPEAQLAPLDRYLRAGRPVIGIRTSTHAFAYDAASPLNSWNSFGPRVLGAPWIEHYGGNTTTLVSLTPHAAPAAQDAILAGVGAFACRSWLYSLRPDAPVLGDFPPTDARVLLTGASVAPGDSPDQRPRHPVAWTWRTPWNGRVFTTTLGHPEDFDRPEFQRLLVNAARWATDVSGGPASR